MSELAEKILLELDKNEKLESSQFASQISIDHQKVVGAIKSLESLGDVINSNMETVKRWQLTREGEQVAERGSHEAVVWNLVGEVGRLQPELMKEAGDVGKVGFSKAIAAGWIVLDKSEGKPVVKRKVDKIQDIIKVNLNKVKDNQEVGEKEKQEYKKRKLIQEVSVKMYTLTKGEHFSTSPEVPEAELTPEMISTGSWKTTAFKSYNFNALGINPPGGFLHPLLKVRAEYRQIFLEMGFSEMPTNNYVESSFWNFDALFQPQQHPARDAHDTFFISDPANTEIFPAEYLDKVKNIHSSGGYGSQGYGYDWKKDEAAKNLLRTHTTAVSARMLYKLAQQKEFTPQKYFSIDKVFRNETLDATHLAEFHQIEGVIADRGLTLGDLIGVLYQFFQKLGIEKLRFKPAYNPYTEPSMEIFSYHEGLGKWVEIGNSGVFRPEMLLPMGLPEDVNVIAWGLSLERPTMIKYGIDNIRDLVGHKVDLDMVQNNPLCRLDKSNDAVERQVDVADRRFDKILEKLDMLQQRVNIAAGNNNVALSTTINSSNSSNVIRNVVIHAPASHPPYSLALLLPSLSSSGPCYVSTHIHSSASNSKPSLILNTPTLSRKDCPIKITLIYKDIPEVTTILTPTKSLLGEASLARYLARLAAGRLYEDHPSADLNKIDEVLDQLSVSLSSKHAATKLLGSVLEADRRPFLAGAEVTLADVLGLGVAKSHNIATPSVNKWRENCERAGLKI